MKVAGQYKIVPIDNGTRVRFVADPVVSPPRRGKAQPRKRVRIKPGRPEWTAADDRQFKQYLARRGVPPNIDVEALGPKEARQFEALKREFEREYLA